jgi:hypothetical protein
MTAKRLVSMTSERYRGLIDAITSINNYEARSDRDKQILYSVRCKVCGASFGNARTIEIGVRREQVDDEYEFNQLELAIQLSEEAICPNCQLGYQGITLNRRD